MTSQIFLIAPKDIDMNTFPQALGAVLQAAPVAALLLPKAAHSDADYAALAKAILPVTLSGECALLLDNAPELAREIGADGVHISTGLNDVRAAIKQLKPDLIVGAAPENSRHDAMSLGETDADYLFFGALEGPASKEAEDNAQWWAETFEVPAVFASTSVAPETATAHNCEFIGLGEALWNAPEGAPKALEKLTARLNA